LTTPSFPVKKQKGSVESSAVLLGRQPVPLPMAAAFHKNYLFDITPFANIP
jgi:hypothetical protein